MKPEIRIQTTEWMKRLQDPSKRGGEGKSKNSNTERGKGKSKICKPEESINFSTMCVLSAYPGTHNTHVCAEHVSCCVLNTHIMSDT